MTNHRVVNLTQHRITLFDITGEHHVHVDPSANTARVNSEMKTDEYIVVDGIQIPIISVSNRQILNLPEPEDGVLYVVSGLVASEAHRPDVVSPSRIVRDPFNGNTRGARALLRP